MAEREEKQYELLELIDAHERHLQALEKQAATMGVATPPHITTEIQRYKAEIHDLTELAGITLSRETVEKLSSTAVYQLLYAHMMRIDGDMWRLGEKVEKLERKIDDLILTILRKN